MYFTNLFEMAQKEKRRKMTGKTIQKVAMVTGIAVLSAAAGLVTGILIAPKSGKETRNDLKKKVEETADAFKAEAGKVKDTVKDSIKEADDVIHDVHGKTKDVKNDITAGINKVKQDIHKTAENMTDSSCS